MAARLYNAVDHLHRAEIGDDAGDILQQGRQILEDPGHEIRAYTVGQTERIVRDKVRVDLLQIPDGPRLIRRIPLRQREGAAAVLLAGQLQLADVESRVQLAVDGGIKKRGRGKYALEAVDDAVEDFQQSLRRHLIQRILHDLIQRSGVRQLLHLRQMIVSVQLCVRIPPQGRRIKHPELLLLRLQRVVSRPHFIRSHGLLQLFRPNIQRAAGGIHAVVDGADLIRYDLVCRVLPLPCFPVRGAFGRALRRFLLGIPLLQIHRYRFRSDRDGLGACRLPFFDHLVRGLLKLFHRILHAGDRRQIIVFRLLRRVLQLPAGLRPVLIALAVGLSVRAGCI